MKHGQLTRGLYYKTGIEVIKVTLGFSVKVVHLMPGYIFMVT